MALTAIRFNTLSNNEIRLPLEYFDTQNWAHCHSFIAGKGFYVKRSGQVITDVQGLGYPESRLMRPVLSKKTILKIQNSIGNSFDLKSNPHLMKLCTYLSS